MKTTILILAIVCIAGVAARTTSGCRPDMYAYVAGKICRDCPDSCATCDTSAKCLTCWSEDIKPTDGVCVYPTGFHSSCAEQLCDVESTQGCSKCDEGYRVAMNADKSTSYCVACTQAGCADCTVDKCNSCLSGYFLDATAGTCTKCDTGCAVCTGAKACTTCQGEYFADNGACTKCGTGCSVCESATKCTTCNSDYLLSSTAFTCTQSVGCEKATDDGTKCATCRDGYRLVATDGTCKACDGNASLCDSAADGTQTIIACNNDYILATKTTTKAAACQARKDGHCIDQTADGACNKCDTAAGANLSAGACVVCSTFIDGCAKCSDGNATDAATCTACAVGYQGTATCTACDSSCSSCTDTTCKCKDGYRDANPAGTSCLACDAGKAKSGCSDKHASSGCVTGAGEYEHGICFACDPSYKCKTCSSYQQCTACASNIVTVPQTIYSISDKKCVVCDPNCTAASGCVSKGAGKCDTACITGYTIDKVKWTCTDNTKCGVTNCNICDAADFSKCTTCKDGFYANASGVCTACLNANCKTCSDGLTCTACKGGYLLITLAGSEQYCTALCSTLSKPTGFNSANMESCTAAAAADTVSAIKCNSGFMKAGDGLIVKCITALSNGCTEAVGTAGASDDTKCSLCEKAGYALDSTTKQCVACTSASTADFSRFDSTAPCTIAAGVVSAPKCASGATATDPDYILGGASVTAAVCYLKDPNCTTEDATDLAQNTSLAGDNECRHATAGSAACAAAHFLDANTHKCVACKPECSACTTTTACTAGSCAANYKQAAAASTSCVNTKPANCGTTGATADICQSCNTGYYVNTSTPATCSKCNDGCICSASADLCTSCQTGYVKDATSTTFKCVKCIANCTACTDATTCTAGSCAAGWFNNADNTACLQCPTNAASCTSLTAVTCKDGFMNYALPTDAAGSTIEKVKFCAGCASNCDTCTIDDKGAQTCTKCRVTKTEFYYLSADGKSCSKDSCSGSDGVKCNKCVYGEKLSAADLKCVDCTADNSCPASCSPSTVTPGGPGTTGNNTTSATDSGSKIAFSLFVLAFIAILGHMMI